MHADLDLLPGCAGGRDPSGDLDITVFEAVLHLGPQRLEHGLLQRKVDGDARRPVCRRESTNCGALVVREDPPREPHIGGVHMLKIDAHTLALVASDKSDGEAPLVRERTHNSCWRLDRTVGSGKQRSPAQPNSLLGFAAESSKGLHQADTARDPLRTPTSGQGAGVGKLLRDKEFSRVQAGRGGHEERQKPMSVAAKDHRLPRPARCADELLGQIRKTHGWTTYPSVPLCGLVLVHGELYNSKIEHYTLDMVRFSNILVQQLTTPCPRSATMSPQRCYSRADFDRDRPLLERILGDWAEREASSFDDAVEEGPVQPDADDEGSIWDDMPAIDSKKAVGALVEIEGVVGYKLPVTLVRPGGYDSEADLVEDLLAKVGAWCTDSTRTSKGAGAASPGNTATAKVEAHP